MRRPLLFVQIVFPPQSRGMFIWSITSYFSSCRKVGDMAICTRHIWGTFDNEYHEYSESVILVIFASFVVSFRIYLFPPVVFRFQWIVNHKEWLLSTPLDLAYSRRHILYVSYYDKSMCKYVNAIKTSVIRLSFYYISKCAYHIENRRW